MASAFVVAAVIVIGAASLLHNILHNSPPRPSKAVVLVRFCLLSNRQQ